MNTFIRRLIGFCAFLFLWELNSRTEFYRLFAPTLYPSFFPSIETVVLSISQTIFSKTYLHDLILTTERTLSGFAIAAVLGMFSALTAARIPIVDDVLHYPFEFLRQLPAVAVLPFAIIIFGIGSSMKIALAAFGCLFPIFVATRNALTHVNSELLLTARSYGWTGTRLVFGVMLPAALPSILAGLRIALAIALILVVIGEMLIGSDGLGHSLVTHERSFNYPSLYAETLSLGALGIFLNICLDFIARKVHFWGERSDWA